ncbi:LOW QUALITY PROTEIN: E3 ubiquitin-protein ligase RNF125 [Phaethornis superciliosus]
MAEMDADNPVTQTHCLKQKVRSEGQELKCNICLAMPQSGSNRGGDGIRWSVSTSSEPVGHFGGSMVIWWIPVPMMFTAPPVNSSRFCHFCISASKNSVWTCPYCHAYLPSEGIPDNDIEESTYRKCTECQTQVCLGEMRAHLRTCEKYVEKYGHLQVLGDEVKCACNTKKISVLSAATNNILPLILGYSCPFCLFEVNVDELMDHCLTYHRSEMRAVYRPICCLTSGRKASCISRNLRHLQLSQPLHYEDHTDINTVGEVLVERVLDGSFLANMHMSHPKSA